MVGKTLFRGKQTPATVVIFCFLNRITAEGRGFRTNGKKLSFRPPPPFICRVTIARWEGDRILMPNMSTDYGKQVKRCRHLIRKTGVLEEITVIEFG